MNNSINIAAVEDNRITADALRAWATSSPGIHLAMIAATVGQLLQAQVPNLDVILLNATLRADPDRAQNVRRLTTADYRVLVIDGSSHPTHVAETLAAGAHGYLTRDHDLTALTTTLRAIAGGGTASSIGPTPAAGSRTPPRPLLSEREHTILMAYASGEALGAVARHLGISPQTAKTYLKRIKAKYHQAGLPVYTKLDLAEQVRADCAAAACCPPKRKHRAKSSQQPPA
jgi:two-component system nitrate/nitrite response regulator NarL